MSCYIINNNLSRRSLLAAFSKFCQRFLSVTDNQHKNNYRSNQSRNNISIHGQINDLAVHIDFGIRVASENDLSSPHDQSTSDHGHPKLY